MARGAKTSSEMLKARKLIEQGATAYAAAKATGLTTGAITRSAWYKERQAAQAADTSETPIERAQRLIVQEGKTAYAASKLTGVAQSTISRSAWYRAHIEGLVDQFKPGGKHYVAKTV